MKKQTIFSVLVLLSLFVSGLYTPSVLANADAPSPLQPTLNLGVNDQSAEWPKPSLPVSATLPITTPVSSPNSPDIIGGHDAAYGAWPWQVKIIGYMPSFNQATVCGGILISPSWILTAAHCVTNYYVANANFRIIAGDYDDDVNHSEQVRLIDKNKIKKHPGYKDPSTTDNDARSSQAGPNDLALIQLDQPIAEINHVRYVTLGTNSLSQTTGRPMFASGWGNINDDGSGNGDSANRLQETRLDVVASPRDVAEANDPRSIWVASPDSIPCHGDSGGPLSTFNYATHEWNIVGVASHLAGKGNCVVGDPANYKQSSAYLNWIDNGDGRNIKSEEMVYAYQITTYANTQKCLDLKDWSRNNIQNLQVWDCQADQNNQNWIFNPVNNSQDTYQIVSAYSGKCLTFDYADANIFQEDCALSRRTQEWKRVAVGSSYHFVSVYSGKCLAVSSGSPYANGTLLTQKDCSSSSPSILWDTQLVPPTPPKGPPSDSVVTRLRFQTQGFGNTPVPRNTAYKLMLYNNADRSTREFSGTTDSNGNGDISPSNLFVGDYDIYLQIKDTLIRKKGSVFLFAGDNSVQFADIMGG